MGSEFLPDPLGPQEDSPIKVKVYRIQTTEPQYQVFITDENGDRFHTILTEIWNIYPRIDEKNIWNTGLVIMSYPVPDQRLTVEFVQYHAHSCNCRFVYHEHQSGVTNWVLTTNRSCPLGLHGSVDTGGQQTHPKSGKPLYNLSSLVYEQLESIKMWFDRFRRCPFAHPCNSLDRGGLGHPRRLNIRISLLAHERYPPLDVSRTANRSTIHEICTWAKLCDVFEMLYGSESVDQDWGLYLIDSEVVTGPDGREYVACPTNTPPLDPFLCYWWGESLLDDTPIDDLLWPQENGIWLAPIMRHELSGRAEPWLTFIPNYWTPPPRDTEHLRLTTRWWGIR